MVRDRAGRILVMRRIGVEGAAWQLPQGGIEFDEAPLDALHRELREETGLLPQQVQVVRSTEAWWIYELPVSYRNEKVGWGQAHKWYLCTLLADPDAVKPDQVEFSAADWVDKEQLIERAVAFRRPIYRRLIEEFAL